MPDLTVDRLTLQLSGLSEGDGRRLAALVADGLATADLPPRGGAASVLRVSVGPQPGEGVESLAKRIVTELLRGLATSL